MENLESVLGCYCFFILALPVVGNMKYIYDTISLSLSLHIYIYIYICYFLVLEMEHQLANFEDFFVTFSFRMFFYAKL